MYRIFEFRIVKLAILIIIAFLGFSQISSGTLAEEKFERAGFWGGLDVGIGFVGVIFEQLIVVVKKL